MTTTQRTRRGIRLIATLGGLGVLGLLIWSIGLPDIISHLHQIGWLAPLMLVPPAIAALCDVKGWAWTIPAVASVRAVSLGSLLPIHLAGEAITNLTPTTYLGGDATRVYLLRMSGVPSIAGLASVIAARTALTLAQVVFILLGLSLFLYHSGWLYQGWWVLGLLLAIAYGFAMLLIRWQRRGLIGIGVRTLRNWFPRWRQLHQWEESARQIDAHLLYLYDRNPKAFITSMGYYFLGWLLGAGEIFLLFFLIGVKVSPLDALVLEAMVQPFAAAALIIPGALGVREVGAVFLCRLLGLDESAGLAVMVLKRVRQTLWHLLGLVVLTRAGYTFLPQLFSLGEATEAEKKLPRMES